MNKKAKGRPGKRSKRGKTCRRGHDWWYENRAGVVRCGPCQDAGVKRWQTRNPEQTLRTGRNSANKTHHILRRSVIAHYGGKCACCGEATEQFLTIDHIGGGGRAHREKIGNGGMTLKWWLKMNGYPEGFRVLCWNCNCSLGIHGWCPHEYARSLESA